jgi:2'-5' RNA ligase
MRAFVALRLNPDSEDAVSAFIGELRMLNGSISWSRRDNLHLTLRFLGNAIPVPRVEALAPALKRIAAATKPFDLSASGTGAFPDLRRPRVIWIGAVAAPLIRLAQEVEAAARACGFNAESRPYSPHLTIGRVRDFHGGEAVRQHLASNCKRDFGISRIESISLYRSHLGRDGATYEELGRYPLGAGSSLSE